MMKTVRSVNATMDASTGALDVSQLKGGRMKIARSRGAASGFLLILLGLWGALIPFVGPYIDLAYTPEQPWVWTDARGWLEVLPGAVAVLGGLLLLMSRNRATGTLGAWLAIVAGAWFVAGRGFADLLAIGDIGAPAAPTAAKALAVELAFFSGLGALIVFVGGVALGRLSVRSVRDVAYVQRTEVAPVSGPVPVAEPAMVDQKTEVIGPTANGKPKRSWRSMFGGGRRPIAHH